MAILQNTTVSGSLVVTGDLTARQYILSSSVSYFTESFASGSTRFGDSLDDIMQVTGSMKVTGSVAIGSGSFPQTFAVKISGSAYNGTNVWFQDASPTDGMSFGGTGLNSFKTINTYGGGLYLNYNSQNGVNMFGSVGIGITNPSIYGGLAVSGSVANSIANIAMAVLGNGNGFNIGDDGTDSVIGVRNSGTKMHLLSRAAGVYTRALTVDSAGNVGIGITNPSNKLDVRVGGDFDVKFRSEAAGGTVGLVLETANTFSGTSQAFVKVVGSAGGGQSQLIFGTAGASGDSTGTERMRINSSGNVGIGTAAPDTRLHLYNNTNPVSLKLQRTSVPVYLSDVQTAGTTAGAVWSHNTENTSNGSVTWGGFQNTGYAGSAIFLQANTSNSSITFYTAASVNTNPTNRMTIDGSGNIGAPSGTNIYNASDVRLKQNITAITDGLSKVNTLNPVKFNWIDGFVESEDGKDMLGFIAQEVNNVVPEAVEHFGDNSLKVGDTTIDNPLRVNEKFIIPVLVKAIQELSAKVTALENK